MPYKLDGGSQFETAQPVERAVLLGASNLNRSFPVAVDLLLRMSVGPMRIDLAMGHGRSYGQESRFFGKNFSGISKSEIWSTLAISDALPTVALITDVGNDLAYEVSVARTMEWVERCGERLLDHGSKLVVTSLPIGVLRRVKERQFRLLRALLFPSCQLPWPELLRRAEHLDERLRNWAESQKTPMFSAPIDWYGFDPIHPRRRYFAAWWQGVLHHWWPDREADAHVFSSHWLRLYLRALTFSSFGSARHSQAERKRISSCQTRLHDGSVIALH